MAKKYFQDLFTTANPSNMDSVLNSVDRVITPNMNHMLLQPYTLNEVSFRYTPQNHLDWMFCLLFFFPQKYWAIVGLDMIKVVLSVLQSGHCLRKMNFTHIVLIPQKKMKHNICLIITLLVWKMWSLELYQRLLQTS